MLPVVAGVRLRPSLSVPVRRSVQAGRAGCRRCQTPAFVERLWSRRTRTPANGVVAGVRLRPSLSDAGLGDGRIEQRVVAGVRLRPSLSVGQHGPHVPRRTGCRRCQTPAFVERRSSTGRSPGRNTSCRRCPTPAFVERSSPISPVKQTTAVVAGVRLRPSLSDRAPFGVHSHAPVVAGVRLRPSLSDVTPGNVLDVRAGVVAGVRLRPSLSGAQHGFQHRCGVGCRRCQTPAFVERSGWRARPPRPGRLSPVSDSGLR